MSDTRFRSVQETICDRFEAEWNAGRPAPIERFLPTTDDAAYLATLEELVLIELELSWERSASTVKQADETVVSAPRVEQYLKRFDQLDRPEIILRLLQQEYRVRQRWGDRPDSSEYLERFPQVVSDTSQIEAALTQQSVSRSSGDAVSPTANMQVGQYRILEKHARGGRKTRPAGQT